MASIFFGILNTARLPLAFSRGSEAARFAKSRQLSKQLLAELEKSSEYTDEFILNSISKVLAPHNIKVSIEPNKLSTRGGHRNKLEVIKSDAEKIETAVSGHIICLPTDVQERDKYTILHEAGHIFDAALNPKSMRCDYIKLINKDEIYNILQKIKEKFFDISDVKQLKKETPQILKEIPDEYVIDALQNIRCRLKTERNQYKLGLRMMFRDKNISPESFINELTLYFRLKFSQKLKLANKLLKNRVKNTNHNL